MINFDYRFNDAGYAGEKYTFIATDPITTHICGIFFPITYAEGIECLVDTFKDELRHLSSGETDDTCAILNDLTRCDALILSFNNGSEFQRLVWDALMDIPLGETVSYKEIATVIGRPKAVRAVATAIANNPLSVAVPCHRVIRSSGITGKYRWGSEMKETLLKQEKEIKNGT